MTEKHDIVIIGGGPGGYVAAIRAAQLGMNTALVEREHLGGICLNWGCIPTKALLRSAEIMHYVKDAEAFGIKIDGKIDFDLKTVVQRSRDVSAQLTRGIHGLMKKNKVKVYEGHGMLEGAGKVAVKDTDKQIIATIEAKHIVIATGARARILPGMEPDGKMIWTYKEAMVPTRMPKKLLVLGSGAIGSEFASFYHDMGAEVTLVEMQDRILPVEDAEISGFVQKKFGEQGIDIRTKTALTKVEKGKSNLKATLKGPDGKETVETFDTLITAVGIVANTEGIGLEGTKVKVEKGNIVTNEWCETAEKGVYAIGDVAGAPWLAHKASHEGVICIEKIAGVKGLHPMKRENIPGCTYCRPQVGSVGLTEAQAKEKGYDIKVGRFPFMGNGKAIALGEPEGLVKTIFDAQTGELLGAHMTGAEVTELIQGYVIGKSMEAVEADFMHTIFPHPTLSEMMHESVLDAYGKALHM
ncbi:MAG: dihydrolipoyl dehydrogenase [Rickettsiales bacterium]|nr:dihydrolipoyl dehydrogenase [Rickettsiales bacterium]|tara:strand:- start:3617 stop:5023 length:1407 start_codon:yes stop_codon:yes gene_type:complete